MEECLVCINMRNKAIILSRVSSFHQDLKQQTEAVYKEVLKDGYKEDDIIVIEDKESAIKLSEEERNGLNRLKEYINNDSSINAVYLYEMSRLSRQQLTMFKMREFFIEHKIQLVCLKPNFRLLEDDGQISMMGSMAFSLFSGFAESEMVIKKARMMRGRRHNIEMGKIGSGRPPFGYSINKDKYYIVDDEQSEIVKRFFLMYSKGDITIADIAKEFKEEGLFPKTSFDTLQQNLLRWLERDYYIGKKPYPQIISKSLFDKVQLVRKKRKSAPKKKYSNRLLCKGIIFDGRNGRSLCGWTANEAYIASHGNGMMIKGKLIDPLIWDYAKKLYRTHLMNPTILKRQLQKELSSLFQKNETILNEIQLLKDKIDKVEERMIFGNLSTQRGDELIEALKEHLSDNERRQLEITNEIIAKQQRIMEADITADFDEETMSLEDKISIVRKVVKKITIVRTLKFTAQISVFNHINDTVSVFEVKGRRYTSTLLYEYDLKEKPLKTRKQSI